MTFECEEEEKKSDKTVNDWRYVSLQDKLIEVLHL